MYNPRGISTAPAPYGTYLQPRSIVPTPSAYPTRPIPPEVGLLPRPPPLTPRSKSIEQQYQESGGKSGRPQSQMSNRELREILAANGIAISTSQGRNYDAVAQAGLLPPRIKLIPKADFLALGKNRMAQYLEDNQMTGPAGGVPVSKNGVPKPEGVLIAIFDRYLATGSGLSKSSGNTSDIKTRFAIIDGEIQAGNNNPQLIRDARKLLKEMVTQKHVTIYEAQSHLKHLRNLNKI
jgi:hypothetical protein